MESNQMDALGLLRIRILRGINLAVRDTTSSDPYVVILCSSQKVKTRALKKTCNPEWNEELTIFIKDINAPITLKVYDHDTFSKDDGMGSAEIGIKRFVECVEKTAEAQPEEGAELSRIQPSADNCLAEESCIVWHKGKMTQDMTLRLRDVECGELQLQLEWLGLPNPGKN